MGADTANLAAGSFGPNDPFIGPAQLPEGAEVNVEVVEQKARITSPKNRVPLRRIKPIEMPGDSLADELVRDRR